MKASAWFRIAAGLLLLFAAGHTLGFLTFKSPTPEGRAVWAAMNNTRIPVGHAIVSYGGFYVGFGWFVTGSMVFLAWLAWLLAGLSREGSLVVTQVAWGMVVFELVSAGLSVRYFSWLPVLFSVVTAVCLAVGAMRYRAVLRRAS